MTFGADILLAIFIALGPTPAHAADSGDFAGSVDIGGGRKMYLECRGIGSPTVVLVAGLRGSAEDWNIAEKAGPRVFPEVAKFTRVCAYDRPGTPVGEKPSRSDPVPQLTTAGTAVADLHGLPTAAGEARASHGRINFRRQARARSMRSQREFCSKSALSHRLL
jgi:pimeloyl-ACP methyl ester carboxylesterase